MAKSKAKIISIPRLVETVALLHMSEEINSLKDTEKKVAEMMAKSLLHALELKDEYTFGHSARVAYYSLQLGKQLGMSENELKDLELASLFHDIGKIGIPDAVLQKPTRLDEHEFLIMREHPVKSGEILEKVSYFADIARYARHHHERFDGRGYPDGLKGEEIPLQSRIILISDTFDAMTSSRPYRKGLQYSTAFEELEEFAGSQFDPNLVKHFIIAMDADKSNNENTFQISLLGQSIFKKEVA